MKILLFPISIRNKCRMQMISLPAPDYSLRMGTNAWYPIMLSATVNQRLAACDTKAKLTWSRVDKFCHFCALCHPSVVCRLSCTCRCRLRLHLTYDITLKWLDRPYISNYTTLLWLLIWWFIFSFRVVLCRNNSESALLAGARSRSTCQQCRLAVVSAPCGVRTASLVWDCECETASVGENGGKNDGEWR